MLKRVLALILLVAIGIVYIAYPYYGAVSVQVYDITKYVIAVLGTWAAFKLIL